MARGVGAVQRRFGESLRTRVAGDDAAERGEQIWGKPGERWFSPEDPIWRVHEDASMFVGGIAALLLQSLHPSAMAGVAGHSGYRSDPWGRLKRTADYIAYTTYATIPDAEAVIAKVRTVHARVRGKDEADRPYRASDPHLLTWVHVAEIESFLTAYQAYGGGRLTPEEADTYVAQTGVAAALLGVPDPPTTVAALGATISRYRPELELTRAARDAADFLIASPPLPWATRPGYYTLVAGAIAILPRWARDQLDLPLDRLATLAGRPLGRFGAGAVRWGLAGVQDGRRSAPPAV
ncbi:MAG: DUF2236 domain-containing protein [Micropruina sp.]|nr:DUF2236 domain-containing protein [Micropruina sp.]